MIKKYTYGIKDESDIYRRFWLSCITIEISRRTENSVFKIKYKDEEHSFYSKTELFYIIVEAYIPFYHEFLDNFDIEEDFDDLVLKIENDFNFDLGRLNIEE